MVKVLVRDNNVEQALRVSKRKSQKEGLFREMRERERFKKPTTRKKEKQGEAVRREKKRQSKQKMVFGF
ncbi:MAG: 30S ribosomal protein S21 [Rickettsiales bacterium]|jgi:small subunit ribosomal protein S21|nr:30S ribosomal protein S21 [Rickettsiales bacterium]